MPIGRGENIGSAYVRIFADGSRLGKDIKDALRDEDENIWGEGKRQGELYEEAYQEGFEKRLDKNEFSKILNKALADEHVMDDFLRESGSEWRKFRSRLRKQYREVGDTLGKELETALTQGMTFDQLRARLSNLPREIARTTQKIQDQELSDQNSALNKFFTNQQDMLKRLTDAEKKAQEDRDFAFEKSIRDRNRLMDGLINRYREYAKQTEAVLRGERRGVPTRRQLIRDLEQMRKATKAAGIEAKDLGADFLHNEERLRRFTPLLHRLTTGFQGFADVTSKGFGRGSRNNFLNFTGVLVRNFLAIPALLSRVAESFVGFARSVGGAFADAGGFISGIGAAFGVILPAAGAAVVGIGAVAAGLLALSAIVGPLVSLLSLLIGGLLALGSTVILGAVGAIAALAGVIAPLALGIGGLIVGIITLDKKSKAMKATLKDLKNSFTGVGKAFGEGFDFEGQLARVSSALDKMRPLARAAGEGMGNFFDGIFASFNSPAWDKFVKSMEVNLPKILGSLGRSMGNVFRGVFGTFRAMLPLVRQFLGWLEDITDAWGDWTNTRAGQRAMKEFFSDAADSAKSLGKFLLQAGGFLADLIDAGSTSGNNMFDTLTEKVKEFRNMLTKEPILLSVGMRGGQRDPMGDLIKNSAVLKGPSPLEQWFKDAERFMDDLGNLIVNAGELMDELDSPEARKNLHEVMDSINQIADAIGRLPSIGDALGDIGDVLTPLDELIDAFGRVKELQSNPLFRIFTGDLSAFGGADIHLPSIDWGKLFGGKGGKNPGTMLISMFAGIGPKILGKIGKINVGGIIKNAGKAVSTLISAFNGTANRILGKVGPVNVSKIITNAKTAVTNLINAFKGMAGDIYDEIAPVNVGNIIKDAGKAVSNLLSDFKGVAKDIYNLIAPVNVSGIISGAAQAASNIVNAFNNVRQNILNLIGGAINIDVNVNWPSPPGWLDKLTAGGGIFAGAQTRIIGEAGPEAVVPLNRPLSMVDPAVRWLSAIAQGLAPPPEMAGGGIGGATGRTVNVDMTVVTVQTDPMAAAAEVVNRLVAVGY